MNAKATSEGAMKLEDIDAEIARLNALRADAEKRAVLEKAQKSYDEAVDLTAKLVETLWRLDELGYMPPRLQSALSDVGGKFNPGMYVKKPKAPR